MLCESTPQTDVLCESTVQTDVLWESAIQAYTFFESAPQTKTSHVILQYKQANWIWASLISVSNFIISLDLLNLNLACFCFSKLWSYIIKSFVCAVSNFFLMQPSKISILRLLSMCSRSLVSCVFIFFFNKKFFSFLDFFFGPLITQYIL